LLLLPQAAKKGKMSKAVSFMNFDTKFLLPESL